MAAKDWAGVTAGLALATFGLGAFVASSPAAVPATTVPPVESAAVVEAPTFVETVLAPEEVFEIPGLSDSTSRLLSARGYADRTPEQELGLSPAVVRVLERAGTVLLVPEAGGS